MFVALLLATAAALAPPYLAGRAIDDGINGQRHERADDHRDRVPRRGAVNWGATYVQTYLINWVGPARAPGPAHRAVPAPPAAVDRLLLAQQGGRADLAPDERRAGARPARHRRHLDALLGHADADRHRGDPGGARPGPRARHLPHLPGAARGRASRSGSPRRARTGSRARRSRTVTAYLQETLSGVRVVRAFGQERRHKDALRAS